MEPMPRSPRAHRAPRAAAAGGGCLCREMLHQGSEAEHPGTSGGCSRDTRRTLLGSDSMTLVPAQGPQPTASSRSQGARTKVGKNHENDVSLCLRGFHLPLFYFFSPHSCLKCRSLDMKPGNRVNIGCAYVFAGGHLNR